MSNPALALLRRVGGEALVAEMIELFLADAPNRMNRLRDALSAQDPGGVAAAAHSFRSSCGNLGAERCRSACERIELAAAQQQLASVGPLFAELEVSVSEESAALRDVLATALSAA
jgi:HPt (histidine-containing phosphotransfer) domain-containing protein